MSENCKCYKLHAKGMHCQSCVILIEETLKKANGVVSVKASLTTNEVHVEGDLGDDLHLISQNLSELIKHHGYELAPEQFEKAKNWSELVYAFPLSFIFVFGFFLLQKAGLVNFITSSDVSYGTAFVIGIIASLSTCLAVVGGLVLSMSASYAKSEDSQFKPHLLFHVGRLLGFFVLGGIVGAIGSSFQLGINGNLVFGLIIGLVMVILGINLLDLIHFTKRFQLSMPKFFARHAIGISNSTHILAPFLVGIVTFFLPCGFTQSMQIYTLGTGSFWQGSLTMFTFALGTFPLLALLSFGSFSIAHKPWKGVFFKTAGLVVIALAIFNIINALVVGGIIDPVFNF